MNESGSRYVWLALAAVLGACDGDDGKDGKDGADGEDGVGVVDPDAAPLDRAVQALGGADAVHGAVRLQYTATGQQFHAGESVVPLGESLPIGTFAYTARSDAASDGLRLDYIRDVSVLFPVTLTYAYILRGELGEVSGVDNIARAPGGAMSSTRWAGVRKQQVLLHPELLVGYALDNPDKVAPAGITVVDGALHDVVNIDISARYRGAGVVSAFIHHQTGAVTKLSTVEDDYQLRDVEVEAVFGRAVPVAGLRIPQSAALSVAGELVLTEERTDIAVNPAFDASVFAFTEGVAPAFDAATARRGADSHQWHEQYAALGFSVLDPEQLRIVPVQIEPGVFWLTGAAHHSLVVEQSAGIVVVEAPLYPERADAIIAWAKTQFSGKPITHVIATHHHADHAGGLRSFVAEGATVVAGQSAAALYHQQFSAPSTVRPDRLAREPRAPSLELVPAGASVRLADALHPVDVHALPTGHADDMVLVSLPGQGVVFESDMYNPGGGFEPTLGRELRDRLVELELSATRITPGHGAMSSLAELQQLVAAP